MNKYPQVAASKCENYDIEEIIRLICDQFETLGISENQFRGKRVVLKPNLVAAKSPEAAATTHPAVVEAVYRIVTRFGADDVVLAESPGGPYSSAALSHIYKVTGMRGLSDKCGLKLNFDTSFKRMRLCSGKKLREFDIITPIADADVIINICKLKTHSLTGLSCAVKNLFGVIPGTVKFEMHAAFSRIEDFSEMLVDLNQSLADEHEIIYVCDGIVSMEGNGPTAGKPVRTGWLLSSRSAFELDIEAERLCGMEGETLYLNIVAERLGIQRSKNATNLVPVPLTRPDSKAGGFLRRLPDYFGGALARFFEPRPEISRRCIGCGGCVGFCPKGAISLKTKKGRGTRTAVIDRSKCIRCYCCQELCPSEAVDTVRNAIIGLVH